MKEVKVIAEDYLQMQNIEAILIKYVAQFVSQNMLVRKNMELAEG